MTSWRQDMRFWCQEDTVASHTKKFMRFKRIHYSNNTVSSDPEYTHPKWIWAQLPIWRSSFDINLIPFHSTNISWVPTVCQCFDPKSLFTLGRESKKVLKGGGVIEQSTNGFWGPTKGQVFRMRDSRKKKLFGGSLKANLILFFDQINHSQFNFMGKSLLFKDFKKMLMLFHVNFYRREKAPPFSCCLYQSLES